VSQKHTCHRQAARPSILAQPPYPNPAPDYLQNHRAEQAHAPLAKEEEEDEGIAHDLLPTPWSDPRLEASSLRWEGFSEMF